MRTIFHVGYRYSGWSLDFKKEFDLPHAPFYNMMLVDAAEDDEVNVELKIKNSIIAYNVSKNCWEVYTSEFWESPVGGKVVDDIIKLFAVTRWERVDNTDVERLKDLMKKDYDNK